MPCDDGLSSDYASSDAWETLERLNTVEAIICGIMTKLSENPAAFDLLLDGINYKEAGISKKIILDWWKKHRKKDAERTKREAKAFKGRKKGIKS